jgi:hypothetical protein
MLLAAIFCLSCLQRPMDQPMSRRDCLRWCAPTIAECRVANPHERRACRTISVVACKWLGRCTLELPGDIAADFAGTGVE